MEKRNKVRKALSRLTTTLLLLTFALAGASPLSAQEKAVSQQKIKPGTLDGFISDSTGKRLGGKQIQIIDPRGKVLGSGTSNKYGMFRIKNLPEGKYSLNIDGKAAAHLQVSKEATVSMLMFIMPSTEVALTTRQWTLIGIGSAAVVIGLPVLINNTRDSSHRRVSP